MILDEIIKNKNDILENLVKDFKISLTTADIIFYYSLGYKVYDISSILRLGDKTVYYHLRHFKLLSGHKTKNNNRPILGYLRRK